MAGYLDDGEESFDFARSFAQRLVVLRAKMESRCLRSVSKGRKTERVEGLVAKDATSNR